jgi:DNA repair exonuclease SbcCD ATPase subunit
MTPKDQKALVRMIGIWNDRRVFSSDIIEQLRYVTELKEESRPVSPPSPSSDNGHTPGLPSELLNKPIFKSLQALVEQEVENAQNKYTLQNNEELMVEYKNAMEGATNISLLGSMELPELQQLQHQYEALLKKFTEVKNAFSRENSARKKYISLLKRELEQEQKNLKEYDNVIGIWTRNVANMQRFQTEIEISVTNKKMLQTDNLVNDYFNADHHQLQSNLSKKRTLDDMSNISTINDQRVRHHSAPLSLDDDTIMNKRQKIDSQLESHHPSVDDLYAPDELNMASLPQQDMHSILDALENTNHTHSLDPSQQHDNVADFVTQGMNIDNYPPSFLSDNNPFPDDNNI